MHSMKILGAGILALSVCAAMATEAEAGEKSPWQLRGRLITVQPDEDSSISPIGGEVDVDGSVVPELDISYFFNDHVAAELILAVTPHDVKAEGTSLGNVDLGDVWLLPPTLTVQYHFTPEKQFRPYVGAGLNYTIFFDEDAGAMSDIDYDNGVGYALQAGFDYGIDEHWAFNADLKKLYLNTDVSINNGAVTADVDLDPWIFGIGATYRF